MLRHFQDHFEMPLKTNGTTQQICDFQGTTNEN